MADGSPIEWTDATWNPIIGCDVVSPGCTNCYAMRLAGTRHRHLPSRAGTTRPSKAGPVWTGKVNLDEAALLQPLRWRRGRRIFVGAHGDLFHDQISDDYIDQVFAVMAMASHHTFQVLTKRPERMREYMGAFRRRWLIGDAVWNIPGRYSALPSTADDPRGPKLKHWPRPNVWLGVSVEDQPRADERIPHLLATPAAVRWISAEPLLGPVDLRHIQAERHVPEDYEGAWKFDALSVGSNYEQLDDLGVWMAADGPVREAALDWVVVGGESGPGARPMHPDWARSLRDQCAAAEVPFLFKQWGAFRSGERLPGAHVITWQDGTEEYYGEHQDIQYGKHWLEGGPADEDRIVIAYPANKKAAGRHLDGVLHDGFPAAGNGGA